jgi:hypothetical protein
VPKIDYGDSESPFQEDWTIVEELNTALCPPDFPWGEKYDVYTDLLQKMTQEEVRVAMKRACKIRGIR